MAPAGCAHATESLISGMHPPKREKTYASEKKKHTHTASYGERLKFMSVFGPGWWAGESSLPKRK